MEAKKETVYFEINGKVYRGINQPLETYYDKHIYGDTGHKKVLCGFINYGVNGNEVKEEYYNEYNKKEEDKKRLALTNFLFDANTEGLDVTLAQ